MSHISVRPLSNDESELLESLFSLSISGLNQGIAKVTSTTFANVTFGSGSGGGTWGTITGTLSNQTDLQAALNAKQATLVSGTTIKTVNGSSLLGSGNLTVVSFGTNGQMPFMNAGGTDFSYTSNLRFNGNTFTLFGTTPLGSPSIVYSGDGSNMTWQTVDSILAPISVDGLLATITNSSLGTTQAANKGLLLTNNTAAAVGAQQISPAIVWEGSGWKTNATAGSEVVKFNAYILPVQEAAHPSASLLFRSSINGGAFATNFGVTSHGELIVNNSVGSAGYILSSNGPGVTASWIPSTTFALSNGSGTTANSTAVDLGGVLTADATIDGGGSADFFIKALKNSFGVGDTTYDSTADKGFIQFKTSGPLAWIGDGGGASHGTYVMVNDGTKIISLVGDGSSKILMKENTLGAASNGYVWTLVDQSTGEGGWVTAGGGGATTALDNLSGVAINAALVLGTSNAFALGSSSKQWSDLFLAAGAVVDYSNGAMQVVEDSVAGVHFLQYGNAAHQGAGTYGFRIWEDGHIANNIYHLYPVEFATKVSGIYIRMGLSFAVADAPENSQVGFGAYGRDDGSETGLYNYLSTSSIGFYVGNVSTPKLKVDANNKTTSVISSGSTKRAALGGKIKEFYTDVGNVGTGEDDLYTYTTEASILGANGDSLEMDFGGVFVSSATATREIKLYFGGTVVFDSGTLTLSLSAAWNIYATFVRVSSSVVRCTVSMTTEGAALAAYTSYTEVTGLTLSNTNVLKLTGEAAGVGAATGDIIAKLGTVSWYPASV